MPRQEKTYESPRSPLQRSLIVLKLSNLHAFYGKSHVLHGVDMHVQGGAIVALLGRND